MKNENSVRGMFLLLVTAAIWGTAFVAQSVGLEHLGTFTFNAIRSFIGAIVLFPFICIRDKKSIRAKDVKERRTLLLGGLICGTALCIASNFQQLGISKGCPVGKAGFFPAFPFISTFFLHLN